MQRHFVVFQNTTLSQELMIQIEVRLHSIAPSNTDNLKYILAKRIKRHIYSKATSFHQIYSLSRYRNKMEAEKKHCRSNKNQQKNG